MKKCKELHSYEAGVNKKQRFVYFLDPTTYTSLENMSK